MRLETLTKFALPAITLATLGTADVQAQALTLEQAETMLSDIGAVDVLVSDVMLPGGRGTDLYARLRSRYPGLRVVFMSGYVDDEILKQTQLDPAMRFIQKPFAADALLSSVTSLLAPP